MVGASDKWFAMLTSVTACTVYWCQQDPRGGELKVKLAPAFVTSVEEHFGRQVQSWTRALWCRVTSSFLDCTLPSSPMSGALWWKGGQRQGEEKYGQQWHECWTLHPVGICFDDYANEISRKGLVRSQQKTGRFTLVKNMDKDERLSTLGTPVQSGIKARRSGLPHRSRYV